jgi:predicted metal-dependent phosphotriesterase family hydrolase
VPAWAQAASEAELADWMLSELQGEIEGSGVQAGWIKLSVGDDGITDCEAKILRAAARAGRETNAVIGVHTKRGRVVRDQLDIIEAVRVYGRTLYLDPHPKRAGFQFAPGNGSPRGVAGVRWNWQW